MTLDGKVAVAGFFHGSGIQFGKDPWDTFHVSSRTVLSRTLFVSMFTPNGTVLFVNEAASCGVGLCDVTSMAVDASGVILTGRFRKRISFGVMELCSETECVKQEQAFISTGETYIPPPPPPPPGPILQQPEPPGPPPGEDPTRYKSTGSGHVYREYCWVAKYDLAGNFMWKHQCFDPILNATNYHHNTEVTSEEHVWGQKAREFWVTRPVDKTKYLGKEEQYDVYSRYRTPDYGNVQPASFQAPLVRDNWGIVDPPGFDESKPLNPAPNTPYGDQFFGNKFQTGNP